MVSASTRIRAGCVALVAACLASAQEWSWEDLLQRGLDEVDRHLAAFGYQLDRDQLRQLPRTEEVLRFFDGVETILQQGTLEDLAWIVPEIEATLAWLEEWPAAAPYVLRLREIADYAVVAQAALSDVPEASRHRPPDDRSKPAPLVIPAPPPKLPPAARRRAEQRARSPDLWRARLAGRPPPPRAMEFAPRLKAIFQQEGIPPELVWLAEVESSFDPHARSPAGAVGLFQLMPATARRYGLNPESPDERLDPAKSAGAAASYLRFLHRRFGSWPLAVAAYNAGEGRVGRLLQQRRGVSFDDIADALPLETRLYVPKVAAVIELREGRALAALPAPRR